MLQCVRMHRCAWCAPQVREAVYRCGMRLAPPSLGEASADESAAGESLSTVEVELCVVPNADGADYLDAAGEPVLLPGPLDARAALGGDSFLCLGVCVACTRGCGGRVWRTAAFLCPLRGRYDPGSATRATLELSPLQLRDALWAMCVPRGDARGAASRARAAASICGHPGRWSGGALRPRMRR